MYFSVAIATFSSKS